MIRFRVLFFLLFPVLLWSQEKNNPVNEGFSLYDQGNFSRAGEFFMNQSLQERNPQERSRALYNAACSFYKDYSEMSSGESLKKAVSLYYRVLQLDPENNQAAHNLEIARKELLKQDLSDNQKDEDFHQDQNSGDSGQEKDRQSPLAQKQDSLAQRQDQASEQHQKEQEELNQQTREALENAGNSEEKNQLSEALEKQQKAMEQMQQGNAQEAREFQKEAAKILNKMSDATENENEPTAEKGEESFSPENSIDRELQQILNAEQSRNEKENMSNENYNRVERNW